jgi:hypothetical protein
MDNATLLERLRHAVDSHDLDAVVACFAPTYRNETPAHPGRGFEGHEQVRTNWTRIFAGVPDIQMHVVRTATSGDAIWAELELAGTRADGVAQVLRGVIIFGGSGDVFDWARFYMEPVDSGADGVNAAVGRVVESDR